MNCAESSNLNNKTGTEAVTDMNCSHGMRIKSRNAVKCEKCGCDIQPGETIVQDYKTGKGIFGFYRRVINCCDKCATPGKRHIKRHCDYCGRTFYRFSNWRRHNHLFCSDICQYNYYNKQVSHARRAARVKECPVCGAIFSACRCDTVYCSDACRQKNYRHGSN